MRAVHWLATLAVLPFVCGHSELRITQGGPSEMPDDASWALFHNCSDPRGFGLTTSDPVSRVAPRSTRIEAFEVAGPVLGERGLILRGESTRGNPIPEAKCSKLLMRYSFGDSMNRPFYTSYRPPDCDFDHVVLHFDAKVEGHQYDRSGVLFLGDVLVWRSTTAEPVGKKIHWSWHKDVTAFLSLWKAPQNLIFELDNRLGNGLTGIYSVTLTASFFKSRVMTGGRPPADLIVPISRRRGYNWKPSYFIVPNQSARSKVKFPRNANRAVFTLDAKAQSNEEFWWHHAFQSTRSTFPKLGTRLTSSPFREILVELDGKPAGFVSPFPRLFTGAADIALWQPIVGPEVFDFREAEIDITPWLPLLCDGEEHEFQIKVFGLDDSNGELSLTNVETSWYVSGKIFVWLDDEDSITTGIMYRGADSSPVFDLRKHIHKDNDGNNRTLDFNLTTSRDFSLVSFVKTQKRQGNVTWAQKISTSNHGTIVDYGFGRSTYLVTKGHDESEGHDNPFSTTYNYFLTFIRKETMAFDGPKSLRHEIKQGILLGRDGASVFPTGTEPFHAHLDGNTAIVNWRNCTSLIQDSFIQGFGSTWSGKVVQSFTLGQRFDIPRISHEISPLFTRDVVAVNRAVSRDNTKLWGSHH